MSTNINENLMLRFLELNFPVTKIKKDKRFKRGIIIDSSIYYIGDDSHLLAVKFKLFEIIIDIFDCNEETSKRVLLKYLS